MFPMMIYRYGSKFEWDLEMFDYLIVNDQEELEIALSDGWYVGKPPKPEDAAAPAKKGK